MGVGIALLAALLPHASVWLLSAPAYWKDSFLNGSHFVLESRHCSRAIRCVLWSITVTRSFLYPVMRAYSKAPLLFRATARPSLIVPDQKTLFGRLGRGFRAAKKARPFPTRHESARLFAASLATKSKQAGPITVSTLLRICAVFEISLERLGLAPGRGVAKTSRRPQGWCRTN